MRKSLLCVCVKLSDFDSCATLTVLCDKNYYCAPEYFVGVNFHPLSLAWSFCIVVPPTLYGHMEEELGKEGSEREISGKD